jgi:hypothetical protein
MSTKSKTNTKKKNPITRDSFKHDKKKRRFTLPDEVTQSAIDSGYYDITQDELTRLRDAEDRYLSDIITLGGQQASRYASKKSGEYHVTATGLMGQEVDISIYGDTEPVMAIDSTYDKDTRAAKALKALAAMSNKKKKS